MLAGTVYVYRWALYTSETGRPFATIAWDRKIRTEQDRHIVRSMVRSGVPYAGDFELVGFCFHLHPLLEGSQPVLDVPGGLDGLAQRDGLLVRPQDVDHANDRRFFPEG